MNTTFFLSLSLACILCSTALGQEATDIVVKGTGDSVPSVDGLDKLTDIMSRLFEKRDAHTAEVRLLKDEVERQKRSGEFPPIDKEIEELVDLEKQFRGERTGCLAMTHIIAIASSFSGTERPIHGALDEVLEHLHVYGHSRDIAIGFERLIAHDGMKTLPSLSRLIDSEMILPFVRDSARLCRARWQLEMVENRRLEASDLDRLTEQSDIQRLQDYLGRMFPSKEVADQWRIQAIVELDELAEKSTNHHVIASKASDAKGIVLVEDEERTAKGPTIAELAKGISFRAKYLSPGNTGPKMEVGLVSGCRWALQKQAGKVVIVQFSFKGCGPCERQYPVLRQIANDYPDKVSILSLMADGTIEATQEAVRSGKMTWNVAWDGNDGPVATQWGIREFPTVYIFGTDQKLLGSGSIPAEYLAEIVKAIVSQDSK
ncbi:MAG: TlpA family protein disulfide reductase [Pirellula sp.]|jgi:thiol-disulfide isomerase/thioredoxin|nr:TlpA family protein disulfide reductase [Pirellula sp.]